MDGMQLHTLGEKIYFIILSLKNKNNLMQSKNDFEYLMII